MRKLSQYFFVFSIHTAVAQDLSKMGYPDRFENSASDIKSNNIASEIIYEFSVLKKKPDSAKAEVITYNKDGNIVSLQTYRDGKLSKTETYHYAPEGKRHQIIKEFYAPKDYKVFEYEYDSAGNEIREYIYNRDTTNLVVNAKVYNDKNQITDYYTRRNNDSFRLVKTYSYNAANVLSKIELFNSYLNIQSTYSYLVDAGQYYKAAYHQLVSDKNKKEEFLFDNNNKCIQVNGYAIQPVIMKDDDGNAIGQPKMDIIPRKEEFKYNLDGTLFIVSETVDKTVIKIRKHYYKKF